MCVGLWLIPIAITATCIKVEEINILVLLNLSTVDNLIMHPTAIY
jgi:hypothetical protein